jgi:5,10-methylenetetrahydromethanopterin reductase
MVDQDGPIGDVVARLAGYAAHGLSSAWAAQTFGYDAMTLIAAAATRVEGIELGTAVVPVYSRLPQVMAQQALTVQAATGGRFTLGVGMSHRAVIEGLWGLRFDRPARYLEEYLSALVPMLAGETVRFRGELLSAHTLGPLDVGGVAAPAVVVAALGPALLRVAGRMADGTVTWMTGIATVGDHIVPTITQAASRAGRPAPRVLVGLPVTVTADAAAARERIDQVLEIYPALPSYRAMLEREGAAAPSEIALVGDEETVSVAVGRLAGAGATDLVAQVIGSPEEQDRTTRLLAALTA